MKFGFIGSGNMGGALATAVSKAINPADVLISDMNRQKAEDLAAKIGATVVTTEELVAQADFIFLGVKPQYLENLSNEIKPYIEKRKNRFVLVSMIAGTSIADIKNYTRMDAPVIRIAPNTPVAIGEGIVLYTGSFEVTDEEKEAFVNGLSEAGLVTEIPENLHAIGLTLGGCGPAFVDLFVEALADGAVASGLPRNQALAIASQMVVGSAKLLLESGKHPGELKDAVCSPGGTTIQGVRVLEQKGFRGTVMDALIAAYEKNFNLKK